MPMALSLALVLAAIACGEIRSCPIWLVAALSGIAVVNESVRFFVLRPPKQRPQRVPDEYVIPAIPERHAGGDSGGH